MGITGAKKAKVYDDATDEYVDLLLIDQGSDFMLEGVPEEDLDGNPVWIQDRAELRLGFMDEDGADQLRTWQKNRTKLKIVVIGVEDYIFWTDASTIIIQEPNNFTPRNRNRRQLVTRQKGDSLTISREPGYELVDENGVVLQGFVGRNPDADADGIEAMNLPPATFDSSYGSISWTIDGQTYTMDTVTLNTSN